MRWSEYELKEKRARLALCSSMKEAEKLIYQWVKEGRIGPSQMSELIVEMYKEKV